MTAPVHFRVGFSDKLGHGVASQKLIKLRVTEDKEMRDLLAEKPKNNANDDEHKGHSNENTNHCRIDVLEVGFFLLLG